MCVIAFASDKEGGCFTTFIRGIQRLADYSHGVRRIVVSICLAGKMGGLGAKAGTGHCTNATGLEYYRMISGLCARRDISKIGDE